MAIIPIPARRIIVTGGFALAMALAPTVAMLSSPAPETDTAACPAGEEEDPYTYACVPHTTPGGGVPGGVGGATGAPSEQELTSCSGGDRALCLEENLYGQPGGNVPSVDTTVHQSP